MFGGSKSSSGGTVEPAPFPQDSSTSWTGGGGNSVVNFGNFMNGINQNFEQGINDRVSDVFDFFSSQINSAQYWGSSLQSFGNDAMAGRSLMVNASNEYKLEIFNNTMNLSANEWAYTAGYSALDIAVSFASPYALEAIPSRIGSLGSELSSINSGVRSLSNNFNAATGGMKQWIRIDKSYSFAMGQKTSLSIKWGAGANHWKKIGNPTLRSLNKSFRKLKLPGNNWRVNDAGHFHIKK